jgi:translation initiation factor 1
MSLEEQLKKAFPNHKARNIQINEESLVDSILTQGDPIFCLFEKRKGKPITILENFKIPTLEIKKIEKELKIKFSVGGTFKDGKIIIQGNLRDKIMLFLNNIGFKTKRIGG